MADKEKKVNNILDFKTFTEKELFKDNPPTKRTDVAKDVLKEKWSGDVEIKKTGEHSDKTIEELEDELETLKKKSKSYQKRGESVPEKITKKEHEINFAIRAKKHWKK